jgi:hypothetical protein
MTFKKNLCIYLIWYTNKVLKSLSNFIRSSSLSLIIILLLLLLFTKMGQASTMLVDMVEGDPVSLFLSFFFLFTLAISLSHYPIYTYYALDLNDSKDYAKWEIRHPFKKCPLKKLYVYVFIEDDTVKYNKDPLASTFRYALGIFIFGSWSVFVIKTFGQNISFENPTLLTIIKFANAVILIATTVLYFFLKKEVSIIKEVENNIKPFKKLAFWFVFSSVLTVIVTSIALIPGFNSMKLILLLTGTYAMLFNYIFFRLLRTRLEDLANQISSPIVKWFFNRIKCLEKSEKYILFFLFNCIAASILILYSSIASVSVGNLHAYPLPNGIPILLAFVNFYYYLIAAHKKNLLALRKMASYKNSIHYKKRLYKKRAILYSGIVTFLLLIIITNVGNFDVKTHELDIIEARSEYEVSETDFLKQLYSIDHDKTMFFIASHGGGLKANVWTLKVLNHLQAITNFELLNHTIAFSGASGGSLGLALYTGLYKNFGKDTTEISKRINALAKEKYTSIDLTMTFGLDSYRKIFPLSLIPFGIKDRPYFSMLKYQNHVEEVSSNKLYPLSYRRYWADVFRKRGYCPSLIMNTAKTNGSRGVLWSVRSENANHIFPYSDNLADLPDSTTLPYYQAISMTNRFPIFSPAAKVKGYGHYIDAGTIDNSGLLGCWDLYRYLLTKDTLLCRNGEKRKIVFIEISNTNKRQIKYLLNKFMAQYNYAHLSIDEKERDNIKADIDAGLSLDKTPEYLNDYTDLMVSRYSENVGFIKIHLPLKISLAEFEDFLGGKIMDETIRCEVKCFLKKENDAILDITEKKERYWLLNKWYSFEPTLARHLSNSTINYYDKIMNYPALQDEFNRVKDFLNQDTKPANDFQ